MTSRVESGDAREAQVPGHAARLLHGPDPVGYSSQELEANTASVEPGTGCMSLVSRGDRHAFEKLHHRYSPRVASFFRKHHVDFAATGDLTQEVFRRVWEKRGRYKSGTADFTYLLGFSRFVLLEHRAELQSRSSSESRYAQDSFLEANLDSPLAAAEQREQHRALRTLMATLPDRQRRALELRYLKDLSSREASERLACTDSNVRQHCRLALMKLRKWLEQTNSRAKPPSRQGAKVKNLPRRGLQCDVVGGLVNVFSTIS